MFSFLLYWCFLKRFSNYILLSIFLVLSSAYHAPGAVAQSNPLTLSAQEDVRYCVDPHWAPYEAIRNGIHVGISAQYMTLISELSGLRFTLVPTESWQQSLEFVQQGKCHVVPMINTSDYRRQFLDFSKPYFEAPNVLVAQKGMPMLQGYGGIGNRTIGIIQGYRQVEYISRYYPSLRLKLVQSEQEGLKKLANGEFDVMVGSLLSVNTHINDLNLSDLVIVGYAEPFDSLAFGVNKSYGHLVDKLNYAIDRIPETRKVQIYKQWNNVKVRGERDYTTWAMGTLLIVLTFVGLIIRKRYKRYYKRVINEKNTEIASLQATLAEKNKTLSILSAHDSATGLYNRNHMIQRAEEEISRFQRFHTTASLIVVELSYKTPNEYVDSAAVEETFRVVADGCLSSAREVDVVSRFNTEQFVLLCPQTPIEPAKILAERLLASLSENTLIQKHLNVAMGMAELAPNEEFNDWFERATKALYQSKRLGYYDVAVAE